MHGSGCQHHTQRQAAVVHVYVQLEAVPGFRVALGVPLDATVTNRGQQGNGFFRRLGTLNVKPLRFGRLPDVSFGRPSFFFGNLDLFDLLRRLFPANDGSGIPTDVADQLRAQMFFYQGIVNNDSQAGFGELGKSSGEC